MLKQCFHDLAAACAGIEWCLIGAQAAIVYGSRRSTQDIDISVMIEEALWPDFLDTLQRFGFIPRRENALVFAQNTRVLLMRHVETKVPIDLVLAGPGLEALFLERARNIEILGTAMRVLAPEDLIASKLLAGREHDIDDIRAVIAHQPDLNIDQLNELLTMFESALDRSDLHSTLKHIFASLKLS